MKVSSKIILSRALTTSGDQAWDFAVPVFLATLLPGKLNHVALVFFVSRLSHVLLLPSIGDLIDRLSRLQVLRMGLAAQFLGVGLQAFSLFLLLEHGAFALLGVIAGGILSSLGSSMTQIGVAQDLVPTLYSDSTLTHVNSRVRQVDLFSEVVSPVVAGILLSLSSPSFPFFGLFAIASWNLVSFFPEYFLIKSVLNSERDKLKKPSLFFTKTPIWQKLSRGWRELLKLPIAPAVFAYALLWLSVLSPHGVLLTSYLKESWRLSELTLGIFRAAGAIFGLAATLVFPILVRHFGLAASTGMSILFQAGTLGIAFFGFHLQNTWVFLGFILLSRIGLYSFSLGEQQIRQIGIPEKLRGSVNATASSLTGLSALSLLGLGSVLGSLDQFHNLIAISVVSVALGAVVFFARVGKM